MWAKMEKWYITEVFIIENKRKEEEKKKKRINISNISRPETVSNIHVTTLLQAAAVSHRLCRNANTKQIYVYLRKTYSKNVFFSALCFREMKDNKKQILLLLVKAVSTEQWDLLQGLFVTHVKRLLRLVDLHNQIPSCSLGLWPWEGKKHHLIFLYLPAVISNLKR